MRNNTDNNTGGNYMYVEAGVTRSHTREDSILQSNCYNIS